MPQSRRAVIDVGTNSVKLLVAGSSGDGDYLRFMRDQARAENVEATVEFVPDPDEPRKLHLIRAADAFLSLSDNIQETFGLTPVEAMAAGLPVIASDWDGYRDTLVDGETALLVPTDLPQAGPGRLLAERHEDGRDSYDQYCGLASLATAVDLAAAGEAFTTLLGDPGRRAAMGAAGQARARALLDWSVVIRRYQELWGELSAIRAAAKRSAATAFGGAFAIASSIRAVGRRRPSMSISGRCRSRRRTRATQSPHAA